jgi:flagellar basal-body rod protein FlgB
MLDRIDRTFEPHLRALRLRAQRSELLAANIANADTPHFQAKDFDFQSAYRNAVSARESSGIALTRTHPAHLGSAGVPDTGAKVLFRHPVQPSIDGNTVELDAEVGRYSENALRYQAALTFTSNRIRGLMTALQGQ